MDILNTAVVNKVSFILELRGIISNLFELFHNCGWSWLLTNKNGIKMRKQKPIIIEISIVPDLEHAENLTFPLRWMREETTSFNFTDELVWIILTKDGLAFSWFSM